MKFAKKIYVILCDDIRMEVDNKVSFMGVNPGDLIIDEVPTVLPSLAFMVVLEEPKIQFKQLELIIKAPKTKPDIIIFEAPPDGYPKNEDIRMLFKLSPFRVKAEGKVTFQIRFPDSKKATTIYTFNIVNQEVLD
jgi:hypothetical protein